MQSLFLKANIVFILLALFNLSCGKRLPPLPPASSSQSVKLYGNQRGSYMILSWKLPPGFVRTDVYRFVEPLASLPSLTRDEFSSRSVLIASVLDKSSYVDRLEFANQPIRLYYAVRFVNKFGQKSDFSDFLVLQPTPNVSLPPALLSADVSQDKITIKWKRPSENIDGSSPVNLQGYNVYRAEENSEPKKLNSSPVLSESFEDLFFEFGKSYKYFVRSLSLDSSGGLVESDDSDVLTLIPRDIFPPSPPEGLSAAASLNSISIFFSVSPEKDVVGYFVFRSEDPKIPFEKWKRLNSDPLSTSTFEDKDVEPGKTYYYFVKAVDKFGNLSQPSEIVSEKLP
jgi:hypothetical protein